ncbi:MAG TPA: hypothetical protein VFF31_32400 [Blastocatellia bacterium]|nr:hypothetical protein [Blastocatellia bacterium]
MSDDSTQKLPGDKEPTSPKVDDPIYALIIEVQSLSKSVQSLNATVKGFEVRLEAIERTATRNSLETKPIWERALAEIAETRGELTEVRAELTVVRAELTEVRSEIAEVRVEIAETRAELKGEIAETRGELRAEMKDGFRLMASKMEVLNEDLLTLRGEHRLLDRRVQNLESKTP